MENALKVAKHHADRIRYLCLNCSEESADAYPKAEQHFGELQNCSLEAASDEENAEAAIVQKLIKYCEPLIEDLRRRKYPLD